MSRYTILIAVRVTHRTVTLVLLAAVAWILWLTHLAELAASALYTCMSAYRQQGHHCLLESVLHVAQSSSSTGAAGSAMRHYPKDCQCLHYPPFPAAWRADPVVLSLNQHEAVLPDLAEVHHLPVFFDSDDVVAWLAEGHFCPLVAVPGADVAQAGCRGQPQHGRADEEDAELGCYQTCPSARVVPPPWDGRFGTCSGHPWRRVPTHLLTDLLLTLLWPSGWFAFCHLPPGQWQIADGVLVAKPGCCHSGFTRASAYV